MVAVCRRCTCTVDWPAASIVPAGNDQPVDRGGIRGRVPPGINCGLLDINRLAGIGIKITGVEMDNGPDLTGAGTLASRSGWSAPAAASTVS